MAFDDSGDEAQRDAVFLIDSGDTEADRIQSAGHVDGTIELSVVSLSMSARPYVNTDLVVPRYIRLIRKIPPVPQ